MNNSLNSNKNLENKIRNHFIKSAVRALDIPYSDIETTSLQFFINNNDITK
jgi:hypothetical protein